MLMRYSWMIRPSIFTIETICLNMSSAVSKKDVVNGPNTLHLQKKKKEKKFSKHNLPWLVVRTRLLLLAGAAALCCMAGYMERGQDFLGCAQLIDVATFFLFFVLFFLCRRFCLCCGLSYVTHNCSSVSLNLTRYAIYHSLHIFMTLPLVHGQAFLAHTSGTHSRHGRIRTRKWCVTVVA